MPKSHDPARERRILYEVIVDCYDEEEEFMGWYYYMADNLEFPIEATARMRMRGGKTEVKEIQIIEIDPKSERGNAIRLGIIIGDNEQIVYISPENLVDLNTSEENTTIINDWLYWHNFDLI